MIHFKQITYLLLDAYEEILSYNEIQHHLEKGENAESIWKFKGISAHQGPLAKNHPDYKRSSYNIRIDWESGEQTYEPLDVIVKDDPITCAIYGRDKNLLDEPGWKRFKAIAKREKKMLRQINQAKVRSYRCAPRYKFGYVVPRNYEHTVSIDVSNNNKD